MYAPDRRAKVGGSSANLNRKVSAAGHQMRPSNDGEVRERNREDDEGRRRLGLKRCNPAWGRGNGPKDSDSDSEDNVTVQSHKARVASMPECCTVLATSGKASVML